MGERPVSDFVPTGFVPRQVAKSSANESQVSGSHYKDMKIQVWDYCHANGLGGIETMVVKYISRWRKKGGLADLEKAKHCIEKLIELERP